ncbi:unnamed protein product [Diatraea saccharalis]|nr:unnamed protein product [Diatraea saccharalis]
MESTNAARQIIASHSSTSDYIPYPVFNAQREQKEKESIGKFTTKVKSRVTRLKRGESDVENQMITPVNLPTAVLQIDKDNMPKFSFGITSSSSSISVNTTPQLSFTSTTVSKPISEITASIESTASIKPGLSKPESIKPETTKCSESYKFSSPVRLSTDTSLITTTPPKFAFGSPERGVDKSIVAEKKDDVSSCVVGTPKETEKTVVQKIKDWQCPDCWVFNKIDVNNCVCCGAKQPSKETPKQSKCSICKLADSQSNKNKCINCEKVQVSNATKSQNSLVQNVDDSSKWKCEDCWVKNDEKDDKCVCCGGKNPKKSNVTLNSTSTVNSIDIGDLNSEWKCDDCWIKNKMSVDKCVACGGVKPGAKKNNDSALSSKTFQSTPLSISDTMKITAKPQPQTWECSSCLVRNENNRSKCICCESHKPGTIKESDKKLFNFSKTPNMNFKFGIHLAAQEISPKSSDEKPAEVPKKSEISETNNNTLPKAPTFSFGVPPKKADDQIEAPKITNSETGKLNFTFGLPKTQASSEATFTPVFGSANKLTEFPSKKSDKDSEKLQEVPKVDFALTTEKDTPKPLPSIFGSQLTSVGIQDKPITSTPSLLGSTNTAEKKDTVTKPLTIQPVVTSEQKTKLQGSFTFTAPEIKPAVNLFAAPATTTSAFVVPLQSAATTNVSLFQKSESTKTTSSSLFQKPETATTSTVSLFQKTDTTTTMAPPSLAATAPIFSFGNNATSSAAPQPEKPKFNFTFGSNSTMFNNSFGTSSTENNTHKFSLSGNRLAAGGNGLASGSALTGGNGLTAKLGSSNELPPSTLSQPPLQPASGIFGAPVQKENLWSSSTSNSSSLFVSNTSSAPPQKPATFSFGTTTPFNAGNSASPAFGNNATTPQNVFGMNQNANRAPSLFSTPVQNQSAPSIFGPSTVQPANNSTPALGLFGSSNVAPSPTFGTANPTIPSFETPSLAPAPAPAPAFNFGAPQPSGIFGFGQVNIL